jgi:hypothetical protein
MDIIKEMKTILFAFLMIITALHIRGQNYQIHFTGNGASSTVDSVKVENLSQHTSLTLAGTDTRPWLHLLGFLKKVI